MIINFHSIQPYGGGMDFGAGGSYRQLDGEALFTVDPRHSANAGITDLCRTATDARGPVRCRANFRVLLPVRPAAGNGRLLFDVVNRGRATVLTQFNQSAGRYDPGDGLLMRRGYTIAWCGWQHDLLSKSERRRRGFPPVPVLFRARVPEARSASGEPLNGRIAITFQPDRRIFCHPLAAGAQQPHPPADSNEPRARLLARRHETAPFTVIPRAEWSFADYRRGRIVPGKNFVHRPKGFNPGTLYTLVYTTRNAKVGGLGLLIVRDFVSFLRYATVDDNNPCAGRIKHAYAFGRSQSGSFLRHLVYRGLTMDTLNRPVFDGIMSVAAGGGRTEINQRFGQPGSGGKHTLGRTFPFADTICTDPVTGASGGLLSQLPKTGPAPKLFLINTSSEYWRGDAALIHVAPDGTRDLPVSDNVRIYHYAGTQHATAVPEPESNDSSGRPRRAVLPRNTLDYRPLLRAALINLDAWASGKALPPPSCYPRLSDGSAVPPEQCEKVFRVFPDVVFPQYLHHAHRMNFGARAHAGIISRLPPTIGKPYPALMPGVDCDGNETTGVRLPEVSVPLATHTGWNTRHPATGGAGQLLTLVGASVPFCIRNADRRSRNDPRPAVAERYPTRTAYMKLIRMAVRALLQSGHLLAEDRTAVIARAKTAYDSLYTCHNIPEEKNQ